MIEISSPRALGLCFLFPPNPSIYSTETHRLREVLATTWRVGGGSTGLGAGPSPGPVFQRMEGEKPKLRTIPGVGTRERLSPICVLLTPQILSQWGPVCAGKREAGGHSLPSRNQCCPMGPRCSRGPCPVSALYLPPPSPKGWLEEVRDGPIHRASWVGGRSF